MKYGIYFLVIRIVSDNEIDRSKMLRERYRQSDSALTEEMSRASRRIKF